MLARLIIYVLVCDFAPSSLTGRTFLGCVFGYLFRASGSCYVLPLLLFQKPTPFTPGKLNLARKEVRLPSLRKSSPTSPTEPQLSTSFRPVTIRLSANTIRLGPIAISPRAAWISPQQALKQSSA